MLLNDVQTKTKEINKRKLFNLTIVRVDAKFPSASSQYADITSFVEETAILTRQMITK